MSSHQIILFSELCFKESHSSYSKKFSLSISHPDKSPRRTVQIKSGTVIFNEPEKYYSQSYNQNNDNNNKVNR